MFLRIIAIAYLVLVVCSIASAQALDIATLREKAEQGDADAQFSLGWRYYEGKGVPQDYQEGARWSRKAAEQGNPSAQYNLGFMYHEGEGVPQDYGEAVKWLRKAAEQGDSFAQAALGFMYGKGEGVPQDNVQAHMWLNLAATDDAMRKKIAGVHDEVTSRMTSVQITEAQKLAREWEAAHRQ